MALAPRQLPSDHPALAGEKIGVLLLNLGTPDATDTKSIRRYLREFLSDERVIEVNPLLWQIILNLFIHISYDITNLDNSCWSTCWRYTAR